MKTRADGVIHGRLRFRLGFEPEAKIVQYYQVTAQIGGVFLAAGIAFLGTMLTQIETVGALGAWALPTYFAAILLIIAGGAALMSIGLLRLSRYPSANAVVPDTGDAHPPAES